MTYGLLCTVAPSETELAVLIVWIQNIYDDKARFLYDYWGPQMAAMTVTESQFNVGLFYLLWFTIMYVQSLEACRSAFNEHEYPHSFAVTVPKDSIGARKHSYAGLVAVGCSSLYLRARMS